MPAHTRHRTAGAEEGWRDDDAGAEAEAQAGLFGNYNDE